MRYNTYKTFILISICLLVFSTGASYAENVRFEGTVINIDHYGGIIQLRTGRALETRIHFSSKTGFLRPGGRVISPYSILPGDHLKVIVPAKTGIAKSAIVTGESFAGELLFINPVKCITSQGQQFNFSKDIKFYLNGVNTRWKNVKAGYRIFVRIDPSTGLAGSVYALNLRKQTGKSGSSSAKIWKIERSKEKSYKKTESINILVKASAGKRVSADIAGIAFGIRLKEVKPGIYRGKYRFRRTDMRRTYLVARIFDKKGVAYRVNPSSFDVAISPPTIEPVYPAPGKSIGGRLSDLFALLDSRGSLIHAAFTAVYIDGKKIKSGLDRNVRFIACPLPRLKKGKHTARIIAVDEVGNSSSRSWSFYVK